MEAPAGLSPQSAAFEPRQGNAGRGGHKRLLDAAISLQTGDRGEKGLKKRDGGPGRRSGLQQLAQEAEVEDLELLIQVHAHDPILTVNAEQDAGSLAVLAQDHLHLRGQRGPNGAGGYLAGRPGKATGAHKPLQRVVGSRETEGD